MMEPVTQQRLFNIEEASERIGLPAWRIYSEIAAERMPCKRVGRRIYFSEADLLAYLQRIQQNGTARGEPATGANAENPHTTRIDRPH